MLTTGTLCAAEAVALDLGLPPVQWSGRLGAQYRHFVPELGEETVQRSYTGELSAASYIWQPWFGNWKTRLAATTIRKDNNTSSESLVLSGEGNVNLFHLSRFPFEAYFDVRDSRVDILDSLDPGREERFVRFGIRQSYTPLSGNARADVNLFRDERTDFVSGEKETANHLIANAFTQQGLHYLNANVQLNDISRNLNSFEQFDYQTNFLHTYTPNTHFTLTNTASYGETDVDSETEDTRISRARIGSNFLWRNESEKVPLRLRGDLSHESENLESRLSDDGNIEETRGSLGLFYLPTRQWRFGLEGGGRRLAGDADEVRTYQAATADYHSLIYPWGKFEYNYNTGAGVRHEQSTISENEKILNARFSHNLNRSWVYRFRVPVANSLSLGQDFLHDNSSLHGELNTLVHRLSYSISAATEKHTSNLHFVAYDSRTRGRTRLDTQSLSLIGVHNYRMTRHSDFSLNYNISISRQQGSSDPAEDEDVSFSPFEDNSEEPIESSSVEAIYRHNRLFRVRNLRFLSRLRASTDSVTPNGFSTSQESDVLWENRLSYVIGKLDMEFRTLSVDRPAVERGGSHTFIFTINRLF